jgi:drug/metabolite transporter (DMT)-like permease
MQISRRSITDLSLLILVNALWAVQYPAYKVISGAMGPVTASAWIFLLATLVLLPFLFRERTRNANPEVDQRSGEHSLLARRNLMGFVFIGVIGLVPASALLAWGEKWSTASNASLIYLTVPIITAIMAAIILKEKMTWVKWLSLLISISGVLILSNIDSRHLDLVQTQFLVGNLLVLMACVASSFYNVYSKELLSRFQPLEVLVYGYLIALIVCMPFLVWVERFSISDVRAYTVNVWVALLVLSLLSWGLAMVLWMFLLKRLDVSQASVSIYLLPFLGVLVSALTLKEKITTATVVGGLVTLMGTILIMTTEPSST